MIINNNIPALNTYRQMGVNQAGAQNSMEKLASGLRINRAGDDAAGLAISEKMRGQIRGLDQASRNAQDGISMIQTAEGALQETHSILQRMRELAVQSSNDTNNASDRGEIQKEIDQLKSEIDRISNDTEFNTKKLINGDLSNSAKVGGTNTAGIISAEIADDNLAAGTYKVNVSGVNTTYTIDSTDSGVDSVAAGTDDIAPGRYTLTLEANGTNFDAYLKDADGNIVEQKFNQQIDNSAAAATLDIGGLTYTWNDNSAAGTSTVAAGDTVTDVKTTATFSVQDSEGNEIGATTVTDNQNGEVTVGGLKLKFDDSLVNSTGAYDTEVEVKTNAVNFHIGANESQNIKLSVNDMSSSGLGVNAIDVTSAEKANEAITTINNAIESVSAERSKLGAYQNRLDHTINNLNTSSENLQAAESRIRDVDMAREVMEMTKNNILSQASQAMLAQANQAPQAVLQLLG